MCFDVADRANNHHVSSRRKTTRCRTSGVGPGRRQIGTITVNGGSDGNTPSGQYFTARAADRHRLALAGGHRRGYGLLVACSCSLPLTTLV